MKTLKIIFNCIIFVILTLLISCEEFENEPEPCDLIWSQTFGGSNNDAANSIQRTMDGGYILVGYTESYGAGNNDAWLIKTDAEGTEQWSQTFGGSDDDVTKSVQQTTDGGYILAGETCSYGAGNYDAWLIKTDANGEKQWDQIFGGSDVDLANSVQQTSDGGYIIAGYTESYGAGYGDIWLIKTDANGEKRWDHTYGGSYGDYANSVQQTSDGGYIVAGGTYSYGAGMKDIWLIKTDANGEKQWNHTYGGLDLDDAYSVQQTSDGGYIVAGWTRSYGAGGWDAWLIKTDANGEKQWDYPYGGSDGDYANSVQQTTDGGYILAGWINSYYDEDGYPYRDVLLIKTDAAGVEEWNWTFGDSMNDDQAWSVQQTTDGDYILAGCTNYYETDDCDALLIKISH